MWSCLRLTVHQSPAPRQIIVAWYNEATENYWRHNAQEITYGLVQDYAILVNGVEAVHVTDNQWSRRTHLIDLPALGIQSADLTVELRVNALDPTGADVARFRTAADVTRRFYFMPPRTLSLGT